MNKRNLVVVAGVFLILLSPVALSAASRSGTASIPQDMVSVEKLFESFQDAVIEAGYTIASLDRESGLISASREGGPLFGNKKKSTYTWNVTIRPKKDKGTIEILMARGSSGYFSPTDIPALFVSVFEKLELDLTKIDITRLRRLASGRAGTGRGRGKKPDVSRLLAPNPAAQPDG